MDPASIASVIVALIAAAVAIASQRSASQASRKNTQATTRVDMEKEAYIRARAFDVDTIEHQDKEIKDLRDDIKRQAEELKDLKEQNLLLRKRIGRLEAGLPPEEESSDGST